MNIEHLDTGELVEHRPRGETRRQGLEARPQGDVQAIGQEGDKDVRFVMLETRWDEEAWQAVKPEIANALKERRQIERAGWFIHENALPVNRLSCRSIMSGPRSERMTP